ncbi:hypothetical protein [Yunchengibacter salinarum]|uniref:hypothetical protein n=1 Tax=Yunchengibacter salinarum TaxID=3133399 RepID=UPI0035B64BFF
MTSTDTAALHSLQVEVLRDDTPFLEGRFDVTPQDYPAVKMLLGEIDMTAEQAAGILSGYMHAREAAELTEEMGKIALVATVFMLEEGWQHVVIPLNDRGEAEAPRTG